MTLEEARALAALVSAGKTRSYVDASKQLAAFVLTLPVPDDGNAGPLTLSTLKDGEAVATFDGETLALQVGDGVVHSMLHHFRKAGE